MSNRQFALFAAYILPLIFTVIGPYSVNDLAVWIAHGRYFLDHGEILRTDVFSVLPTLPMVYPAWGVSIIYALIDRVGGLVAVCLFHSVLLGLLLHLIYRNSIWTLPNPASRVARFSMYAFWLGAVAALGERPSMVALLPLLLAFLEIQEISELTQIRFSLVAKLCLLNILWVNIHGSFILLLLMLLWKSAFLLLEEWKNPGWRGRSVRSGLAVLAVGLSAGINPFTYRVYPFILETMRRSRGRMITEWEITTPFAHPPTGFLYFSLLLGVVVLVIRRWGRPGFWSFLSSPFFPLLLNGGSAIRNAAIPFVVLLPAMRSLGYLGKDSEDRPDLNVSRPLNFAKAGLFMVLLVLVLPTVKPKVRSILPPHRRALFDNTAPLRIAEWIRNDGRTCPIFNGWEVGSYLLLALPNRIFFDGRNIIYSDEQFREYVGATLAHSGWEIYLEKYGACFAVIESPPLIAAMRTHAQWKFIMEENGNHLFAKVTGPERPELRER